MRCWKSLIIPETVRFDCDDRDGHTGEHVYEDGNGLQVLWPDDHLYCRSIDPRTLRPILDDEGRA